MARTRNRSVAGSKTVNRSTTSGRFVSRGKTASENVASGKTVNRSASSGRFTSGSSARGARVQPPTDSDLVGSVRLTTPQQVARLGRLKQRVDAELQRRGMRDSA